MRPSNGLPVACDRERTARARKRDRNYQDASQTGNSQDRSKI
jgi:hypothetical protein